MELTPEHYTKILLMEAYYIPGAGLVEHGPLKAAWLFFALENTFNLI